ncbi:thioredoxin-disulfide reductase [Roseococcus sp. XZZS9]|uniref:Thioredoxin reductase n=1 Tax=Roseococcus pinisoli TaxID=2835040 RepID=A0ABS5QB99_9PROT|nr:thioredoxin-disulfide reductase [Roseococcus pinisoli]
MCPQTVLRRVDSLPDIRLLRNIIAEARICKPQPCPAGQDGQICVQHTPSPDSIVPAILSTRLLIIGAGPAGYTAAIYAARAGLKPVLVAGMQPGGQLTITTDVENYPGFATGVQGPELMEQMRAQAEHVGTELKYDIVTKVDLSRRPFRAECDSGDTYLAESVVIATGAQARWLGIPGEQELSGFGVSACATCDGFFFRGKDVAVIGGGNSAVEEALYLSNLASHVTLVHRRDTLRAERILQQRLFAKENITVLWDMATEEMLGTDAGRPVARALSLRHVKTGERRELAVDGIFVAIGHDPATALFRGQLDMDESGYLAVSPGGTRTNIAGVFAAGDVADKIYRQAVTAAGTGCMAALDAEKFLAEQEHAQEKAVA